MIDFPIGPSRPVEQDSVSKIEGLSSRVKTRSSEQKLEALKDVSKEFEAVLYQLLLKQMRKTVPETGFMSGGRGEEIFRDFLDEEYSKIASKSATGLGLAAQIYEQYSKYVK